MRLRRWFRSRKVRLSAAAVALLAIAGLALAALRSDDGAGQSVRAPATPVPGPLTGPIDGGFVVRFLRPGESPEPAEHGIVFVDVWSGSAEFWSAPTGEAAARAMEAGPRLTYEANATHRWLQFAARGSADYPRLIGDRETGKTYAYDPAIWELIAGPTPLGMALFRASRETNGFAPGRAVAVDLVDNPTGVKYALDFSLPGGSANNAVILAGGERFYAGGYLIDPHTSQHQAIPARERSTSFALDDGGLLFVSPTGGQDPACCVIQRFAADGSLLLEKSMTIGPGMFCCTGADFPDMSIAYQRVLASPDGRWVAWQTWLPLRSPPMTHIWPAVIIAETQRAEVILRAVRASMEIGPNQTGWLSDSSGMVVATPEGYAILRPGGSLEHIEGTSADISAIPVAAPREAKLLAYQGRAITTAGRIVGPDVTVSNWQGSTPQTSYGVRTAGLDLHGDEVRLIRSSPPQADYPDIVLSRFPLPAKVQLAPLPRDLRLKVNTEGDRLNVREYAGNSSKVLSSLPDGRVVTVQGFLADGTGCVYFNTDGSCKLSIAPGSPGFAAVPDSERPQEWWLHVRADDGLEGWVSADFLVWAD